MAMYSMDETTGIPLPNIERSRLKENPTIPGIYRVASMEGQMLSEGRVFRWHPPFDDVNVMGGYHVDAHWRTIDGDDQIGDDRVFDWEGPLVPVGDLSRLADEICGSAEFEHPNQFDPMTIFQMLKSHFGIK